ncbi:MAG: hypothetical protein PWQ37_2821 [Candidatus Petromonas sp.]|uniref:hypothetical protein n=1 Tax=Thermoanaerobacter sp. (strain X514) TaxID=399726 RepID=UPI0000E1DBBA|nr:hypothetical protein [Thermoanaerobacter sp. X514]ABY91946.1 hypothetical protein Teth514_0638 [Thermoanaerobacter sp. X514]MDI3501127.1 hypothetical protein [Thermoanaerobacter sp.]MDK2920088.1 hypothetical protein [Candidatus Petromonas sp.]
MGRNIIIVFLLLLMFSSFFAGCGIFDNSSEELLREVKAIEELSNKYANFYLSTDTYIEKVKEVAKFADEFNEAELIITYRPKLELFPDAINMVKRKNLALLTEEQLKEIRNTLKPVKTEIEVQISKVYDDGKNKYIFSKGKVVTTYKGHFYYDYYLRKYTFINEGNEWKIMDINTQLYGRDYKRMENVTYKNKPVEFVIKFNQ